eukprot:g35113.t1
MNVDSNIDTTAESELPARTFTDSSQNLSLLSLRYPNTNFQVEYSVSLVSLGRVMSPLSTEAKPQIIMRAVPSLEPCLREHTLDLGDRREQYYLPRAQARDKKKGSSKERRMRTLLRVWSGNRKDHAVDYTRKQGEHVGHDAEKTHLPRMQARKKKENSSKERHVRESRLRRDIGSKRSLD